MTQDQPSIGAMFGASDASAGFLGFPRAEPGSDFDADIALLGVPCASPYASVGPYCAEAPGAIRAAAAPYGRSRHHQDFDLGGPILGDRDRAVVDLGDLPYDATDSPANRAAITAAIAALLHQGTVPIVIGGDDSVPIPVFQAFKGRGPLTLVQVDAHIDWRQEVEGERFGLSSTMRRSSEMAWIERIIQVGARATGSARPQDYQDALDWGVAFLLARDLHAEGLGRAIAAVPEGAEVLLSIDVDGMDPSVMPAVIGPSPGGLMHWHMLALLQGIAAKARIAGACFVEFVPSRDPQGLAALTVARLICNTVGLIARQP